MSEVEKKEDWQLDTSSLPPIYDPTEPDCEACQ